MLLLVIPHPEKGFQLLQTCSISLLTTDQLVHLVSQPVGLYLDLQLEENIELVPRRESPVENVI